MTVTGVNRKCIGFHSRLVLPWRNEQTKKYSTDSVGNLILPNTSVVKLYENAHVDKTNVLKTFANKTIIYMWFNKINGKVYIGSAVNGKVRLSNYFRESYLKSSKKSKIYNSLLKHGHDNFSLVILEVCGDTSSVAGDILISKEEFYLDWALKTYGLKVLNIRPVRGGGHKFRQSNTTVLKATGTQRDKETRLKMSSAKLNSGNPNYGKTGVISSRTKI